MLPPGPEIPPVLTAVQRWVARLRLGLRRQSRKLYRTLRHPRQRAKGRLREWLGSRIHNRDLWHLRRGPVANGVAGGLFIAMLPVPLQSLFAAAVGIARGWNLPAAVIATWLSNPFTYVPMFLAARKSVMVIYHIFGAEPALRNLKPSAVKDLDMAGLWSLASHAGPELVLGYSVVGLGCAIAGYIAVHSLWWLVRHHEEPPSTKTRHGRGKHPHPANP
ncbi:MAG: DUF2062 domain-containing protein [Verrucomicrobiota bacterium]